MSELTEIVDTAEVAVVEAVDSKEVGGESPRWERGVALTTLIMALLAALATLLASKTANEALLGRTEEIVEMSYLEGDRIYVEILKSKHEMLNALGETPDQTEVQRVLAFEAEMRGLEAETSHEESLALSAVRAGRVFAISITLLSLGITLGGMSVVVERKFLWAAGLLFGVLGAAGVGTGVVMILK